MVKPLNVLAISGSLRAASSNGALIEAAMLVAPPDISVQRCTAVGSLPHFNPDLDVAPLPPMVAAWRDQLRECDGVLVSSPEYAHGVPGAFKNALDWIVSSGEFMNKPTALLSASSHSLFVTPQLMEILTVMMARVVVVQTIVPPTRPASALGYASDPACTAALLQAFDVLRSACGTR